MAGGQVGAYALMRVDERLLRIGVVAIGLVLTAGLFIRAYG
jgi:uncharacterized protein